VAVIRRAYALGASVPTDWPIPYAGRFKVSGTFGFLGPYEVRDLAGQGQTLFHVDLGRLEERKQRYTVRIRASMPPMGIQADPHITVQQELTAHRIEPDQEEPPLDTR
jgi:hypothetical protein